MFVRRAIPCLTRDEQEYFCVTFQEGNCSITTLNYIARCSSICISPRRHWLIALEHCETMQVLPCTLSPCGVWLFCSKHTPLKVETQYNNEGRDLWCCLVRRRRTPFFSSSALGLNFQSIICQIRPFTLNLCQETELVFQTRQIEQIVSQTQGGGQIRTFLNHKLFDRPINKRTAPNWKFTFGYLQESVKDDSSTETPPTSPPFNTGNSSPPQGPRISPVPAHKGIRKLTTSFRNRSPTGQSPVTKTRKPCQNGKYH